MPADGKEIAVVLDGVAPGDGGGVTIGADVLADEAPVDVGQHAAVGDGQRVAGAGLADPVHGAIVIVVCPVDDGGGVVLGAGGRTQPQNGA